MTRPETIDADIALELGGDISPGEFRKAVDAFVGFLDEMTTAARGDGEPVEWLMKVKDGSLLIGAAASKDADPNAVERVMDLAGRGLAGDVPADYPAGAVDRVRALSALKRNGPRLWVGRKYRDITQEVCAALSAAVRPGFEEYGTVEGRLAVLNERREPYFTIVDRVWNKSVRCTVPDTLLDDMPRLWRKRIAAHGPVRYGPDGLPLRIDAEEIEEFPDDGGLPSHMDVLGILRAGR